jgi:hypothetical protein
MSVKKNDDQPDRTDQLKPEPAQNQALLSPDRRSGFLKNQSCSFQDPSVIMSDPLSG